MNENKDAVLCHLHNIKVQVVLNSCSKMLQISSDTL